MKRPVAQRLEQVSHKHLVPSSNLGGPTFDVCPASLSHGRLAPTRRVGWKSVGPTY